MSKLKDLIEYKFYSLVCRYVNWRVRFLTIHYEEVFTKPALENFRMKDLKYAHYVKAWMDSRKADKDLVSHSSNDFRCYVYSHEIERLVEKIKFNKNNVWGY